MTAVVDTDIIINYNEPINTATFNASISGDTTSGGLARLPRALERNQPSVVVLALGGNDGLRAIPIPEFRRNLAEMIQLARAAGAKVLLAGIHIPPNYGPAYTEAFHQVYHELAAEYGVSAERIRQIEAKALRKLKHPSRSRKLRSFLDS